MSGLNAIVTNTNPVTFESEEPLIDTSIVGIDNASKSGGKVLAEIDEVASVDKTRETALNKQAEQEQTQKDETVFEEVKASLEKLNSYIPVTSTNLVFEFDDLGDPPIIKVLDKESDEVIREIPPQEFREVAQALSEFADKITTGGSGILFDKSV